MEIVISFVLIVATMVALVKSFGIVNYLTASEFRKITENLDAIWVFGYDTMKMSTINQNVSFYYGLAAVLDGVARVGVVRPPLLGTVPMNETKENEPVLKVYIKNANGEGQETHYCHGNITEKKVVTLIRTLATNLITKRLYTPELLEKATEDIEGVEKLTYANFVKKVEESKGFSLVYFFTTWSERCNAFRPQWRTVVMRLKDKVAIFSLDAYVYTLLSEKHRIVGYPTIKLFKDRRSMEYIGPETWQDIEQWVLKIMKAKPVNLVQITSQETFNDSCQRSELCIVTVLPKLRECDSECRSNYLGMLGDVAKEVTKLDWKWVWAEAEAQPQLESALTMGDFDYPELAVVNFISLTYALWREPFIEIALRSFFNEILTSEMMNEKFFNNISIENTPKWVRKNSEKSHDEF